MISPTEIRIGNWYHHNGNWNAAGYNGSFRWKQNDWYAEAECMLSLDDIDPIEITDTWLGSLGFERTGFNAYELDIKLFADQYKKLSFAGDYLYLREGEDNKRNKDHIVVLWNKDIMKKWYVHQLQTLVHALTGKELNTKQ